MCLLIAQKVLYKLPNDIQLQLSTLHALNRLFIFRQNTQTAIAWTPDAKKKSSINSHINTYLCQFMAQNSKIWGLKKIVEFFDNSKIGTFWPGKWPVGDIFNKEASWLHAELFFVLVSMWLPQQHTVSIWTPHGIHVETLWCPVETT